MDIHMVGDIKNHQMEYQSIDGIMILWTIVVTTLSIVEIVYVF